MIAKPVSHESSTHVLSLVPILLLAAVAVGGISWMLSGSSEPDPTDSVVTRPVSTSNQVETTTQEPVATITNRETDEDVGEDRFFTNVRQRTSTGLRSGEGYFSADGKRMVFQSERSPENPFYQIFVMDFEFGDVIPISPGHGKTTCAWIHPDGQRVMYASTQDDPDAVEKQKAKLELRASGKDSRYNWDYDEHYELYAYDLDSKEYTQLTDAVGYDAEGSYSPDGTKIAFASNRRAYLDGELSELEQQQFDFHQAAVMDIYIMDADGSNVMQLTEEPGYDGGPFFSPDGERICWRRFKPDMSSAEIWTMNIDGSDKRKLTEWGHTSFAPFYHPSNEYILFMSNPEGYANFEIYMIPVNRRAEPIRITFSETFDGFPTFSRDGQTFSWTSNRGDGKSQVFTADWNHDAAMAALGESGTAVAVDTTGAEDEARDSVSRTSPEFVPEDILRHVDYLCRPELEGRMTGSRGERMATSYVAAYLDSLGFMPAGDIDPETGEATWFQQFEFPAGARLGENNELIVGGEAVALDDHWRPLTFSDTGQFTADVVAFAGYGMDAPENDNLGAYDSFVHLDVTDKWVMVFRFMPEDVTPEWRQERNFYSQLRIKAANVRDRGGKGLLLVSGPNSQVKQQVIPLSRDSALGKISIPVISISDELAQKIMDAADQDLGWWQTQLDNGDQKIGFDIPNVSITANVDVEQLRGVGRNVVGRLQFGETQHDEAVIIGAHIDHLGRGGAGSLAREDEATQIHYGADDNASGVSAMLEISQFLAAQKREGRITSGRDLVVAGWSGEELGLHGSDHFVDQCIEQLGQEVELPAEEGEDSRTIKSINSRYVAYLNMDMVGRFDGKLVLQGLGSSDWWAGEIEKRNLVTGLQLKQSKDTSLPTDATEFYQAGVPILAAFTGSHQDYHTPRDTPDKLNYEKAADIAKLMGLITRSLVTGDSLPDYQEYKSDEPTMRVAMRASLGTSPDYTEEVQGVLLKSVRSNSPADKAGVQGGDIVVELAGQKVENVYDYTNAIGALKVGQEVTIVVMRDGERLELAITPESSQ